MEHKQTIRTLHIIALASHGKGISGGDRIFIELARRWQKEFPITIHTWKEGREMCARQNLKETSELRIKNLELGIFTNMPLIINYVARIFRGIILGFTFQPNSQFSNLNSQIYFYNASEFWMDSLPCVIIKLRYPQIRWVATWYQTAPNPLVGFREKGISSREKGYFLRALLYWFVQLPIKPLIKRLADKVIVNNEEEKKQFPIHTKNGNTIVLIGAVPLEDIKRYLTTNNQLLTTKSFDAVFQGRFHPQKGVVELVNIWGKVVQKLPKARLAMIGDGPLREEVELRIKNLELGKNIDLFGYVFDGKKKYEIFARSKLVVHPAFYDSGGMATAEAMAFGIPAVGFDLKAYESYYPKGMIRVKDEDAFAEAIIDLLKNIKRRERLGKEAYNLIEKNYSWETRAREIVDKIRS